MTCSETSTSELPADAPTVRPADPDGQARQLATSSDPSLLTPVQRLVTDRLDVEPPGL